MSNSEPEPKAKCNNLKPKEVCGSCKKIVHKCQYQMIQCDLCDQWYHYECVGTNADKPAKIDLSMPWIIHEGPDMLLYLYSKYIRAVIFLPLIFLSSYYLYACSVFLSQILNAAESLVKFPSCYGVTCANSGRVANKSDINILNMCNQVDPTIEIPQRRQKVHASSNTEKTTASFLAC